MESLYTLSVDNEMAMLPPEVDYIIRGEITVENLVDSYVNVVRYSLYFLHRKLKLQYHSIVTVPDIGVKYTLYHVLGFYNTRNEYVEESLDMYYVVGQGLGLRFEGLLDVVELPRLTDPTFTLYLIHKAQQRRTSDVHPVKPGTFNIPSTAWSVHGEIDVTRVPVFYRLVYFSLTSQQREEAYRDLLYWRDANITLKQMVMETFFPDDIELMTSTEYRIDRRKPALEQFTWGRGFDQTPMTYPTKYPTYSIETTSDTPLLYLHLTPDTSMTIYKFLEGGYRDLLPEPETPLMVRSWRVRCRTAVKRLLPFT